MDDAKPDTVTILEQLLLQEAQSGSDKIAAIARRDLSSGTTVAV